MKLYGVVIMDIEGSRNMLNRQSFQNELMEYIKNVNKKYNKILTAPISITIGDEWQAITNSPGECYEIVHEFQQYLWEAKVEAYAGIGIGELHTKIYLDTRYMDGPCFHAARNAIEIAKSRVKSRSRLTHSKHNKIYFDAPLIRFPLIDKHGVNHNAELNWQNNSVSKTNATAAALMEVAVTDDDYYTDSLSLGELINVLIENTEILKARMTPKQKKIYTAYLRHGTYRKILEEYGDELNLSIGGISQKLNSAEFFTIQRNRRIVKSLLNTYCSIKELTNE